MGATVTTDQRGFSLLETMIALCILAVVAAGVLPLGILAAKMSENNGHLSARTAEYAQDKIEQLVALAYGDATSDTRQFPSPNAGGSALLTGMPRELKLMHAVLAIVAPALFVQSGDWVIAAWLFGGGCVMPVKPNLTPSASVVVPPSSTHWLVVLFQTWSRNVPAFRSA